MIHSNAIESNLETKLENSSFTKIINDDNDDNYINNEEKLEVNSMDSVDSMDSDGHNSEISFYDWDRNNNSVKQHRIEFRDIYQENVEFKEEINHKIIDSIKYTNDTRSHAIDGIEGDLQLEDVSELHIHVAEPESNNVEDSNK